MEKDYKTSGELYEAAVEGRESGSGLLSEVLGNIRPVVRSTREGVAYDPSKRPTELSSGGGYTDWAGDAD